MKLRKIEAVFVVFIAFAFSYYLWPESPGFPPPPQGSPQSIEPADTETPLRRAYFTDANRKEVITHYKKNFSGTFTLNFNYPPEEAQTIIRDQTRSYYLEELANPLRESLYINGFVPQEAKDNIILGNKEYYQKITIRYVPSDRTIRILVGFLITLSLYFLYRLMLKAFGMIGEMFSLFIKVL